MSVLIMIHGFAASSEQWKYLSEHLINHGLNPSTVELIGHGNGDKPSEKNRYSVENIYDKLIGDIDAITDDKVSLIGHSLGGYLSLLYAHQFPDRVESLVLINPLYSGEQLSSYFHLMNFVGKSVFGNREHFPRYFNQIGYQLSRVTHPYFEDEVRTTLFEGFDKLTPRILNTLDTFADLSTIIPEVYQPALLIWGDKDRTLNPELYPHFAELLQPMKIKIFEEEDHSPHLTQPAEVCKSILDFFRLLEAS